MTVETYGRITVDTEYSEEFDNWTVFIIADGDNHLFSHYSCSPDVYDEVVGLAIKMAKVLQNLGGA